MSGQNVKGLNVQLEGETTGLEAALKNIGKAANDINKELGQVEKGLKFDPTNTVLLGQKQELLEKKIAETRKGLDALRQAEERVEAMYKAGEIDKGQYRVFQRELATTESKLKTFEGQVKQVDTAQNNAGKSTSDWGDKLKGMAGKAGAAALAAGGALVAMGAKAVSNADDLQKLADKTGLTAERLQELQYVGDDLGVDLETIAGAQGKLTKSMNAARGGAGSQAEAFKALGISVTDSNGNLRDAKTVMMEAFGALNGVGNETERDALSMAIFGKSAMELNPLIVAGTDKLADLSKQARDSGSVMSNDAVAGLDAFGDGMDHLKTSIMATIGQAFEKIMPVVQPILDALLNAPGPIKVLVGVVAALGVGLAALTPVIMAFTAVEWASLAPILPIIAAIGALIAIIVVCIKYHEEIKQAFVAAWSAIQDAFSAAWNAIKDVFWAGINFIKDNWQTFLAAILAIATGGLSLVILLFIKHWDDVRAGFWKVVDGIKAAWSAAIDWIKGVPGKIVTALGNLGSLLLQKGKDVIQGLLDGLKWLWENEVAGWLNIGQKIKDAVGDLGSLLKDVGRRIISGLWDGMKEIWKNLEDWGKGLATKITGWIHFSGGPLYDVGIRVMEGFGAGIREGYANAIPDLQRTLSSIDIGAAISPAMSSGSSGGVTNSSVTNTTVYNTSAGVDDSELVHKMDELIATFKRETDRRIQLARTGAC